MLLCCFKYNIVGGYDHSQMGSHGVVGLSVGQSVGRSVGRSVSQSESVSKKGRKECIL